MGIGNLLSIDIIIIGFILITSVLYFFKYRNKLNLCRYYKYGVAILFTVTILDMLFILNVSWFNNYAICMSAIILYIIMHAIFPYIMFLISLDIIKNTSILKSTRNILLCSIPVTLFSALILLSPIFGTLMEITKHSYRVDATFYPAFNIFFLIIYLIYTIATIVVVCRKMSYISGEYTVVLQFYIVFLLFGTVVNIFDKSSISYIFIFGITMYLIYIASFSSQNYKIISSLNTYNRNFFINTLNQMLADNKDFIVVAISIDQFKDLEKKYSHRSTSILLKNLLEFFKKIFPANEIYHYDNLHFILVFEKTATLKSTGPIIDDIVSIFNIPWDIDDTREKLSVTITSLFCPEDSRSITEILDVLRNSVEAAQAKGNGSIIYGKEYIFNKEREITSLIAQNKQLEKMANEAIKSRSKQAQTEKERTMFLANISHEIRTPLNSVMGLSELILKERLLPSIKNKAESIKAESYSLLNVFNNMMDYFNIDSDQLEIIEAPYDIKDIASQSLDVISAQAKNKNLNIELNIDKSIPCRLIGDSGRIRQLIINLLRNSLKHTKAGSISLNINYKKSANSYIELFISVKDTSDGYKPEELENIFNNLTTFDTRSESRSENSALSLDVCKKLIMLMNGEISVDSTYQNGCTFSFHIPQKIDNFTPISEAHKTVTYKTKPFSETFIAPNANVLVVDDNRLNREIAKGLLLPYKVNVTTANSGEECIKLVKKNIYDLIFMDHLMPVMDGIDTKNHIRSMPGSYFKSVPIIILTANVEAGNYNKFISEGFADYIPKPIDISLLDSSLKANLPSALIKEIEAVETNSDTDNVLSRIHGMNRQAALKNFDSPEALMNELRRFSQNAPHMLTELENAINYNNISLYLMYLTNLTDASQKLGFEKLVQLGNAHEKAAQDDNVQFLRKNVPFLIQAYKKLISEIV